jgi:hypothetical protein
MAPEGGSGSHNKPIGCGASGAYAPDPVEEEEEDGVYLSYLGITITHCARCTC